MKVGYRYKGVWYPSQKALWKVNRWPRLTYSKFMRLQKNGASVEDVLANVDHQYGKPALHDCQPEVNKWELLGKKYGCSATFLEDLYQRQNGQCRICGKTAVQQGKELAVDHCHVNGHVRGFLCNDCNLGLGYFRDRPDLMRRAATYIDFYGSPPSVSGAPV